MRRSSFKSSAKNSSFALASALIVAGQGWADLPVDKYKEWSTEKEIFVPMRDGTHLSTDVRLPKDAPGKLPTVLVRTPYDKDTGELPFFWQDLYLKQGYAVVMQSERGRFFSEGYYKNYLEGASTDGYDTADWIAKQPWSNGKIGTFGCSSSAEHQWPMAAGNHPAHAAMIPISAGDAVGDVPGNATRGAIYHGGVPMLSNWALWYNDFALSERLLLPPNSTQEQRIRLRNGYSLNPKTHFGRGAAFDPSQFAHLPTKDLLRTIGSGLMSFENYLTWTPGDARWKDVEQIGNGAKPRVPALHINTWHDRAVGETVRLFQYVQNLGTPNQYLIVGAGPHCVILGADALADIELADLKSSLANESRADLRSVPDLANLKVGDLEIGDARYGGVDHGYSKLFLNWFDYWLNSAQNKVVDMPKVQVYVMGQGWISGDRWPLQQVRFAKYYLNGDPASRLRHETGILSTQPSGREEKDSYVYDPGLPIPTRGGDGGIAAPPAVDQRPIMARKDVLVYATPPLDRPVTLAGPVDVVLYVSSSAKDTDFMVKLMDIYPDGKAINLADDAFRVRYREGYDKKVLMQPGGVYKITLSNMVTGNRFPSGHRIGVQVSSSNFPLHERNLNTGGNNYDETKWVVAENSIHRSRKYPSHVVLPVLPD